MGQKRGRYVVDAKSTKVFDKNLGNARNSNLELCLSKKDFQKIPSNHRWMLPN